MRTTLADCDSATLAAAFTTVYAGYVMALTMSPAQVERHVRTTAIDLSRSPLWLDDEGAIQAMATLGIRGARGWIGGFGVAPPYRGQRLGHALLRTVIEIAVSCGIRQLELEVLTNNPAAIHIYERGGFQRAGDNLLGLRNEAPPTAGGAVMDALTVDRRPALEAIALIRPQPPCWQRERATLLAQPELSGVLVGAPSRPRAAATYRVSATDVLIADVAARDAAAAAALLASLARTWPGRRMHVSNEPERSVVHQAMLEAGWTEVWRQHRMVRPLPE